MQTLNNLYTEVLSCQFQVSISKINDRTDASDPEIKETTDTASSASFLDFYLEFDIPSHFSTRIYDKRDDFDFKIINFPHLSSNITTSPASGI